MKVVVLTATICNNKTTICLAVCTTECIALHRQTLCNSQQAVYAVQNLSGAHRSLCVTHSSNVSAPLIQQTCVPVYKTVHKANRHSAVPDKMSFKSCIYGSFVLCLTSCPNPMKRMLCSSATLNWSKRSSHLSPTCDNNEGLYCANRWTKSSAHPWCCVVCWSCPGANMSNIINP